jgi:hypothetical protein
MRAAPLPLPGEKGEFPEKRELSAAAAAVLSRITRPAEGTLWQPPEPEILEGTDPELRRMMQGYFKSENWAEGEKELTRIASEEGMDGEEKGRILFYIGECQYFQYRPREAFLSFLLASDCCYHESRKWMIRIYRELTPIS